MVAGEPLTITVPTTGVDPDGDSVTVTSRSGDPVDGLAVVRCDVRDGPSVDAAFAAVEADQGPVEVLVANAGVTRDTLLALMSEDAFAEVLDTNLTGAYRVAKRAVRGMMRMRRGRSAPWIRDMLAEHRLHASDLIWPLFICDGKDCEEPIAAPIITNIGIDTSVKSCNPA